MSNKLLKGNKSFGVFCCKNVQEEFKELQCLYGNKNSTVAEDAFSQNLAFSHEKTFKKK